MLGTQLASYNKLIRGVKKSKNFSQGGELGAR